MLIPDYRRYGKMSSFLKKTFKLAKALRDKMARTVKK